MKKTKLLLASPILIAPVAATIPMIASCGNNAVSLSSELTKYADVEISSEGETYYVSMSIKDEFKGTQFLPSKLTKVKTGDKTLLPVEETNEIGDYYEYIRYDNNTEGLIIVNEYQGPIQIEGTAATLKSISATGVDITESDVAEFEVGETLENDTSRVEVEATLSNEDTFILDGGYEITLPGHKVGEEFTATEAENTGTVAYQGKTADFQFKVVQTETVMAYKEYYTSETYEYSKFSTIRDAVNAYNTNSATKSGYYYISVRPQDEDYAISSAITINQQKDTHLTIQSLIDPYWYEEPTFTSKLHAVNLDSIFSVVPNGDDTSNSSITFYGLQFNEPVSLSASACSYIELGNACHDIVIDTCNFVGDEDYDYQISAVSTATNASCKLVTIKNSIGSYLENVFQGDVTHTADSTDLSLFNNEFKKSKALLNVIGTGITVHVTLTDAEVMWDHDESGVVDSSGAVTIDGSGTFKFIGCTLTQLTEVDDATGLINIVTGSGGTATTDNALIFKLCTLSKIEDDDYIYDVNNASQLADTWNIWWDTEESGEATETLTQGYTWSHDEE